MKKKRGIIKTKQKGADGDKGFPGFSVLAATVIVVAAAIIAVNIVTGNRKIMNSYYEDPVDSIEFPGGISAEIPEGFSAFKTENNIIKYTLVMFDPKRVVDKLVRMEITYIPSSELNISSSLVKTGEKQLGAEIVRQKILQAREWEKIREANREKGVKFDENYGDYRAGYYTSGLVNSREWARYTLTKKTDKDGRVLVKNWSNLYTVYGGNLIVVDYIYLAADVSLAESRNFRFSANANYFEKLGNSFISTVKFPESAEEK